MIDANIPIIGAKAQSPTGTAAELSAFQLLKLSRDVISLKAPPRLDVRTREAIIENGGLLLALETLLAQQGPSPVIMPAISKLIVRLGKASGLSPEDIFDIATENLSAALEEAVRAEAAQQQRDRVKAEGLPGIPKEKP